MSPPAPTEFSQSDLTSLAQQIRNWCSDLGFQGVGITHVNLADDEKRLKSWLNKRYHGSMAYMEAHGNKRSRPAELLPGTLRVISVRLDYTDTFAANAPEVLNDPEKAFVSRYALGRDYHKVMRGRLKKLAQKIERASANWPANSSATQTPADEPFRHRVFVDSAPVLEKALARDAGIGWIGKHTNLINKRGGSWFFLGELFTNLPLPTDEAATDHCGSCTTCIDVCPTQAIVAPYSVDARRCISYLTIENKGPIPEEFRRDMGNRIYGCDDCQLFCPWNKFANSEPPEDFLPRHRLDNASLIELFLWTPEQFDVNTRGSAIRRTGYTGWLRNLAVALGNAPTSGAVVDALRSRREDDSALVREHVKWALDQHELSGHNSVVS